MCKFIRIFIFSKIFSIPNACAKIITHLSLLKKIFKSFVLDSVERLNIKLQLKTGLQVCSMPSCWYACLLYTIKLYVGFRNYCSYTGKILRRLTLKQNCLKNSQIIDRFFFCFFPFFSCFDTPWINLFFSPSRIKSSTPKKLFPATWGANINTYTILILTIVLYHNCRYNIASLKRYLRPSKTIEF